MACINSFPFYFHCPCEGTNAKHRIYALRGGGDTTRRCGSNFHNLNPTFKDYWTKLDLKPDFEKWNIDLTPSNKLEILGPHIELESLNRARNPNSWFETVNQGLELSFITTTQTWRPNMKPSSGPKCIIWSIYDPGVVFKPEFLSKHTFKILTQIWKHIKTKILVWNPYLKH